MSVNKVNQSTGELSPIAGGTLYADAPVGSIQAYGGATAPWGWLLCQGQAVSRATYAELFGVIGTSFGAGDGSTTFNVPDLRETVPVGSGTRGSGVTTHDTYTVGQFKDDQVQDHTHVYLHIPQDTHSDLHIPSGSGYAYGNLYTYSTGTPNSGRHGDTTHGKQLGVNYIIKATTIALPSDFSSQVDDMIDAKIVDNLTNDDMRAATSNTVYNCVTVDPTTEDITSCLNTDVATAGFVSATYFHNKQILINFNNIIPKVVGNGKTLLQNLPFNFGGPQAVSVLAVDISQSTTDTHCMIYTNYHTNWLGAHLSGAGKHYYGQIISVIR